MKKHVLHFTALLVLFIGHVQAVDRVNDPKSFTWKPELSPSGPVVVTVDLKSQKAVVFRNGIKIGGCIVSTGKPGHETPTGTFQILEKDADHHSSTYNNASMPYTERLTWGGVALHAGSLPGYPSSHGCIHLPYEFSKKLFAITDLGGTVVISKSAPDESVSRSHRIEFQPGKDSDVILEPHASPKGPISVVFSSADERVEVIRNGIVIASGEADLKLFAAKPEGTYTYICEGWTKDEDGKNHPRWHQVAGPDGSSQIKAFTHIRIDTRLKHAIDMLIQSGTTLILTDEKLAAANRSEAGFSIMHGSLPKGEK